MLLQPCVVQRNVVKLMLRWCSGQQTLMDPRCNPDARLQETLTYHDVTSKELSVLDMTAIILCQENNIPVVVFNLNKPGNITKAIKWEGVGALIGNHRTSEAARG